MNHTNQSQPPAALAGEPAPQLATATQADDDDDCQLCEQERDLEPGTFTEHAHGGVPTPEHGGAREGSGRKPRGPRKKLGHPAYVSLRLGEKREVERKAKQAGLSVSCYIRKRLGFSTDV